MASIRQSLNFNGNYFSINREERNLAAIFYHVLLMEDNLQKFCKLISYSFPLIEQEFAIYFEYSFLRDIWFNCKDCNEVKRGMILDFLQPLNQNYLKNCSIEIFNEYYGAVPKASSKFIQSPSNWSIERFKESIENDREFLNACEFKWSFNAKPDIVIHTTKNNAICIEVKLESKESYYPSKQSERKEFFRRKLNLVSQTTLQKKIMEELLGIETEFIFLIQKGSSSQTHKTIFWSEVFNNLDTSLCPHFIKESIKGL